MYMIAEVSQYVAVASFAEAWIEISICDVVSLSILSPPSRRRGLKFRCAVVVMKSNFVASFAEAWIEIVIS